VTCKRVAILGWAHSVHIIRWVRGLTDRGLKVKLISLDGTPIDGIDTIILPRSGKLSYFQHGPRVKQLIRQFNPDLVHAHYAVGNGLWGMHSKQHPFVISVWGSDIVELKGKPLKRWLVRRILRSADHITATSNYLAQRTTDVERSVSARLSTIPFGVTVPESTPPLPPYPLRLAFIKHHFPRYAPELIVQAVDMSRQQGHPVSVTFAGEGPMTARLKSRTEELGLTDSISFVGWVESDHMTEFLTNHHAIIMPSRQEAFGVAVLEAAALGRPAITSDIGGIPEVVRDGKTGLTVPADNTEALAAAIIKLASDPALVQQLGKSAHSFVQSHYTWDRSLDMMLDLYDRLLHAAR
jgi:glycosyltransferase involved in cell wall biosynthesis